MIRLFSLLFFALTLQVSAQSSLSYDGVVFSKNNVIDLSTGMRYTGRLEERYANGKLKAVSLVENGKLVGSSKTFYPSGQTHFIFTYEKGELSGMLTEYFANGEMKFQAEIGNQSRYGGNEVKGFLYCYYGGNEYQNKYKSRGRLELITGNGLSPFFNSYLPPNKVEGYRVFENKLSNYGMLIEDSRDNQCPEVRDPLLRSEEGE